VRKAARVRRPGGRWRPPCWSRSQTCLSGGPCCLHNSRPPTKSSLKLPQFPSGDLHPVAAEHVSVTDPLRSHGPDLGRAVGAGDSRRGLGRGRGSMDWGRGRVDTQPVLRTVWRPGQGPATYTIDFHHVSDYLAAAALAVAPAQNKDWLINSRSGFCKTRRGVLDTLKAIWNRRRKKKRRSGARLTTWMNAKAI